MKCPDCGQYSLTYDFERNGWTCHVYHAFIPDEHIAKFSPIDYINAVIRAAIYIPSFL